MGSGIAEVFARAGLDVMVSEASGEALEFGRTRLTNSLETAVKRGKLTPEQRDEALSRLSFTVELSDFADRDLVVEAVAEREDVKVKIFETLDRVIERRDAILASNTSSIPIVKLAAATSRPEQVIGLHFFNPAPVQKLVEVIPTLTTSAVTTERVEAFASQVLAKEPIRARDRAGFVVNALLVPYLLSAVRMFESGVATASDIDKGMEAGCAHPRTAAPFNCRTFNWGLKPWGPGRLRRPTPAGGAPPPPRRVPDGPGYLTPASAQASSYCWVQMSDAL